MKPVEIHIHSTSLRNYMSHSCGSKLTKAHLTNASQKDETYESSCKWNNAKIINKLKYCGNQILNTAAVRSNRF